jgi:FdhD protein
MLHSTDESVPPLTPGYTQRRLQRWRQGAAESVVDFIAEEVPIAMLYNEQSFAVMMATPCDLEDFALGFSLSERLIRDPEQLLKVELRQHLEGIELAMTVSTDAPATSLDRTSERLLPGRGSCGICGTRQLEDVVRQPAPVHAGQPVPASALRRALQTLKQHQPMNEATGSTHAAAWASITGEIELVREDVGRHNALDKLTGAMRRAGHLPDSGMLLISSRASYEMVTKAAHAGIGFVAAVSAPTALAIELARGAGLCLVGFARGDGYNVYTFPERLLDHE